MPPDENTRLADRDIATIREWIEAGAASSNRQVASISASAAGYDDVIPVMLMHSRCVTACDARKAVST